ncbi:response regulator [Paenibacillus lemnae]|uniref:Response regulator transcription factor n=1 Tax=Paenibacillus lemnae TaxID=1330551 RepID=A0A848M0H6_PAELE|nr:response regulator transcription factor [Paenibacillus lemnae]NMO94265.1 response regulator transcription factor [Paenibacillus lemnae]
MFKVIIADDRPHARLGLRMLLSASPEYRIVGEACNGTEVLECCKRLLPDLLLTDLKMPGLSVIEGAERLKAKDANMKIIILTALDECEDIYKAAKAGVDGYFMKDTDPGQLLSAIQCIMGGAKLYQTKENIDHAQDRWNAHAGK